jgi:hypothetical protein
MPVMKMIPKNISGQVGDISGFIKGKVVLVLN